MIRVICPNAESCLVYQNYVRQTESNRVDIIAKVADKDEYNCMALDALYDMETGVEADNKFRTRFDLVQVMRCAIIELLNQTVREEK